MGSRSGLATVCVALICGLQLDARSKFYVHSIMREIPRIRTIEAFFKLTEFRLECLFVFVTTKKEV